MRIISGICRGRRLKSPKGQATRPTQDRIRETIFNVLQNYGIHNRNVLDLFAGTGAMGLEALSRGASSLNSIDNRTHKLIEDNGKICSMEKYMTVINASIDRPIRELHGKCFQLIFSDPPYNMGYTEKSIAFIEKYRLADKGALIVLECEKSEEFSYPSTWILLKKQIFGYTKVIYFEHGGYREE